MDLPPQFEARGLPIVLHSHAIEEMDKEGSTGNDVAHVLEDPTKDAHGTAFGWKRGKTLIVRYRIREGYILVHGFRATTRRIDLV